MNLPNTLTLLRFFFIPLYLFLYFSEIPGRVYWAFGVLLLAGLTDVIDGYLARRNRQVTQLGIMLDPLADKLLMLAVFLSLLISQRISLWAALAVFARDLGMIFGSAFFHFRGKRTVPANFLGKLTTFLFYVALYLLLFDYPNAEHFLWIVIALSFITFFIYLFQFKMLNQRTM
ncbi:MAG: CDP-alcohol phosphatidyltransferase family protein [Planifilum sp.]